MSREGALWIGGLEPYMDEEFLLTALRSSGADDVLSIKVIKNKFTGQVAGYGFVNFPNDQVALMCMHRLNGKIIPNSRPPARFKLNHNSNRLLPGEKNHSIWVGDLTPEVDDLQLYKFFSARFQTIVSAKIVLDESGESKGFGFVRFGNETEQQTALTTMQNVPGPGGKPIKVSIAVQKAKDPTAMQPGFNTQPNFVRPPVPGPGYGTGGADYNQYYNQYNNYWSNMAAWQQYNQYYQAYPAGGAMPPHSDQPPSGYNPPLPQAGGEDMANGYSDTNGVNGLANGVESSTANTALQFLDEDVSILEGPLNQPVQHTKQIDYYKLNRRFFSSATDLVDSLEESGWGTVDANK